MKDKGEEQRDDSQVSGLGNRADGGVIHKRREHKRNSKFRNSELLGLMSSVWGRLM